MNNVVEKELKPCPFCGSKPEYIEHHEDNGMPEVYYKEYSYYYVRCLNCGCQILSSLNGEKAIEIWNRRIGE